MFLQRKINKKCKWLNFNFEESEIGVNQKSSPLNGKLFIGLTTKPGTCVPKQHNCFKYF